MGICDSPVCTFCGSETEDIIHLLWSCEKVQVLLHEVNQFLAASSIHIDFNKTYFILGPYDKNDISTAYVLLYIKFFIYRCKCQKSSLSLPALISYLKFMVKVLKQVYKNENKMSEYESDWYKWKTAL